MEEKRFAGIGAFALGNVTNPQLPDSPSMLKTAKGGVVIPANWSYVYLQLFSSVVVLFVAFTFLRFAIFDPDSNSYTWLSYTVNTVSALLMMCICWSYIKRLQWGKRAVLAFDQIGFVHHELGRVKWSQIRDFWIPSISFGDNEQRLRIVLYPSAFTKLRIKNSQMKGFAKSLFFYVDDHAIEFSVRHLPVSVDELFQCAQFFYYGYTQRSEDSKKILETENDSQFQQASMQFSQHFSLRSDAFTRRLNSLRNKR